MAKTLKDEMPRELVTDPYNACAAKYADEEIQAVYWSWQRPWPGPQMHVHFWVHLRNGKAVGWNEHPARGWSFPVIRMPS